MANLKTNYLGLELSSPVIAASSGLTNSLENLVELEKAGAGAVVLKSLFEEEIVAEVKETFNQMTSHGFIYPETMDYFDYDTIEDTLTSYLKLIHDAKKELSIPVIASINCVSSQKWTNFAKDLQDAGADAIELNVFVLPSDFNKTSSDNEKVYFDVIEEVKKVVSIPVSIKISNYLSNLGPFIKELSETDVDGIVMFNRSFHPDFDLDAMEILPTNVLSSPTEAAVTLRWMAITSGRVACDLAATTGIHDGRGAVKQILAGAKVVQVASAFYKHGLSYVAKINEEIEQFMDDKGFDNLDDFRGKMNMNTTKNAAALERVQFMKNFRDRN
jgi:dihydroorotate dehydrogenase (fumarate)